MAIVRSAFIFCGDRFWDDPALIQITMERETPKGALIIQGSAPGADTMAATASLKLGRPMAAVPYFGWLGRGGGPARNTMMLNLLLGLRELGWDVGVHAFHAKIKESTGTKDMLRQATAHRVYTTVWNGGKG